MATKNFPPKVKQADTQYPKSGAEILRWAKLQELGLNDSRLVFYRTERFGWVLCTLSIAGAKRGMPARTYGITVEGEKIATVGQGPHVLDTVEIVLSNENLERLSCYVDLWKKGMALAGEIRDSISTKRANTRLRRSQFGF